MNLGVERGTARARVLQGLGWIISLICLWVVVDRTELQRLGAVVEGLRLPLLIAALLANVARVYALVLRWWVLLQTVGLRGQSLAAETLSFSYALNSLLPARLGDLIRIGATARRGGQSTASITALLVIERLQDLLCIVLLVILALPYLPSEFGSLGTTIRKFLLILMLAGAVGFAFAVWWRRRRGRQVVTPERSRSRPFGWMDQAQEAARVSILPPVLIKTLSLSLLSWSLELMSYLLVFEALGLGLPVHASLVVCALGSSVTMIPSAPAALGTYELAVQSLLQAYGVELSLGLGTAVLLHAVVLGPVTLAGLLLWPRWAPELARARRGSTPPDQTGRFE